MDRYWEYRPKWYELILKLLGTLFLGFIALMICGCFLLSIPQDEYHYEYIDLDNNKGIAKGCSYKFTKGRAGGKEVQCVY